MVKKATGTKKKASAKQVKKPARKPAIASKKTAPPLDAASLSSHLDALLHTMRCIAQHEDELCTLLHETRRRRKVSSSLLRDLRSILQELPAEEYTADLDQLREELEAAA
jgi:hypothetical protein